MVTTIDAPKVFISYSWEPPQNKEWVIEFSKRLSSDGVRVVLDEWDLYEGQDIHAFMEKMVLDKDINKVLVICNKTYTEKANDKKGGVGKESLIISNEVYDRVGQNKFIPIIREFDEKGELYLPVFMKGRFGIDLISEPTYEENYEKLLRTLYNKPKSKRPPLGVPPSYLIENEPNYLPTTYKVNGIENALLQSKENSKILIKNYLDTFYEHLKTYKLDFSPQDGEPLDEVVYKSIEKLNDLKNDFNNFINIVCKYSIKFDAEIFHSFFEKLLSYLYSHNSYSPSPNDDLFDNFKFFYYEIFLYFANSLLKYEFFKELAYILHHPFLVKVGRRFISLYFTEFNQYVKSLSRDRNERLKLNRVNLTADLIKQRAEEAKIDFENLKQTDVLLCYIAFFIRDYNSLYGSEWYPRLSVYEVYSIDIMQKSMSKRYFDKIKPLFKVETKKELSNELSRISNNNIWQQHRVYYEYPPIKDGLNIDSICTID